MSSGAVGVPEKIAAAEDQLLSPGSPFALVRSGVTARDAAVDLPVAIDAPDLAAVVDALDGVQSADR